MEKYLSLQIRCKLIQSDKITHELWSYTFKDTNTHARAHTETQIFNFQSRESKRILSGGLIMFAINAE